MERDVDGKGCGWQGVCMVKWMYMEGVCIAESMHGKGMWMTGVCGWQRAVHGMEYAWKAMCMYGKGSCMATEAGSTHPTGCILV